MKYWILVPMLSLAMPFVACDSDDDASGGSDETTTEATLAEDLQFLREEEKLARDVYITLYSEWGVRVFDNISDSEQTHTDQVRDLLLARDLTDPVVDDTVGLFVNETLGLLYLDLVAQGELSEIDALIVGATIEYLDIQDIAEMAARTEDPEVLGLYEGLMCGSRNHLRAFYSQLEMRDTDYSPQFISQEDFDAIVSSDRENCGS